MQKCRKLDSQLDDPIAACRRYFDAIVARDLEAVLESMTPEYGGQLRELRRAPDFGAFFSLWCETQGRLVSIVSCTTGGERANAVLDTGETLVRATLRRCADRWLVDAECELKRHRSVTR